MWKHQQINSSSAFINQFLHHKTTSRSQRPDIIQSELLWLAAIHCDRDIDVVVQQPIQNKQGKWVSCVLTDDTEAIETFAFHANNPKEHEWLLNTVRYVAQNHITRYLQDESFLLDVI